MTTQDVIIPGDTVLSRSSSRAADAPKTYRHRGRMTEQHNRGDVGWRVNDQPAHRPDWSVSNWRYGVLRRVYVCPWSPDIQAIWPSPASMKLGSSSRQEHNERNVPIRRVRHF